MNGSVQVLTRAIPALVDKRLVLLVGDLELVDPEVLHRHRRRPNARGRRRHADHARHHRGWRIQPVSKEGRALGFNWRQALLRDADSERHDGHAHTNEGRSSYRNPVLSLREIALERHIRAWWDALEGRGPGDVRPDLFELLVIGQHGDRLARQSVGTVVVVAIGQPLNLRHGHVPCPSHTRARLPPPHATDTTQRENHQQCALNHGTPQQLAHVHCGRCVNTTEGRQPIERCTRRRALFAVFLQTIGHQFCELGRDALSDRLDRRRLLAQDRGERIERGLPRERPVPRESFVQHGAQGEYVAAPVNRFAARLFG